LEALPKFPIILCESQVIFKIFSAPVGWPYVRQQKDFYGLGL